MTQQTMTPESRLARLEETMATLLSLLGKEAAAAKAVDLSSFEKLQTIKKDLFDVYQDDVNALIGDKESLKRVAGPAKDRLKTLENKLASARTASLSAIDAASKSFTRLRERIVHIARDNALRSTAQYGANGVLRLRTHRVISTGLSDRA